MLHRKKVEIVVDDAGLDEVLALIDAAGAKGYTVVRNVEGKGDRGLRAGHDLAGSFRNALVIVVAPEDVARRIVEGTLRLLEGRPGIVLQSDVEVARGGQF